MIYDLWHGLEERLRAVANNRNGNGSVGVARIEVELHFKEGELVGYARPVRIPYEPRGFDCTVLDLIPTRNWNSVVFDLKRRKMDSGSMKGILVVKDGKPRGWLSV